MCLLSYIRIVYTEKIGAKIFYLSNIAGMNGGTKEAISLDGRRYFYYREGNL